MKDVRLSTSFFFGSARMLLSNWDAVNRATVSFSRYLHSSKFDTFCGVCVFIMKLIDDFISGERPEMINRLFKSKHVFCVWIWNKPFLMPEEGRFRKLMKWKYKPDERHQQLCCEKLTEKILRPLNEVIYHRYLPHPMYATAINSIFVG